MPIRGFKPGQNVLTPSGKRATVIERQRKNGRERVTVSYTDAPLNVTAVFDASALRMVATPRPDFDPRVDYPERFTDGPI